MKRLLFLLLIFFPHQSFAWDGYDSETGDYVEIEKGNLVRRGQDIEVYDHGSGEYKDVTVEGVREGIGSVEVEVYDYNKGEYKTYEMEKK